MPEHSFIAYVLIFLVAAVITAALFRKLQFSLSLGFLAAGVVIGPYGLGLVVDTATMHAVAELGIVFLMFLIGLELSIERLIVMRRMVFGLGIAQVLVTGALIGGTVWFAGLGGGAAIVIGVGLAFSSTAVVLQVLSERGELATRWARACVAVLLLQDLAVVPMLTLIPALAGESVSIAAAIGMAALKAAVAFGVIYFGGRLVLRPVMRAVAATRSAELFSATTLLVLLGSAWITGEAGLSSALGGFLAGTLLAGSEYRHQVAADMAPFEGILLGLFFMVVGMAVDLHLVAAHVATIVAAVIGLLAVKAAILAGLCRLFAIPPASSLRIGLVLAQGGEFGFLLFTLAASESIIPAETASLLVATISVAMAATPFLAAAGAAVARRLEAASAESAAPSAGTDGEDGPRNHVVIAGFGRVGQSVAKMLSAASVPYVALEFEPTRVAEARAQGLPVFYGDARRPDVLNSLGAARARAAVVIMDNADAAERTVDYLHRRYPKLDIFARARDDRHRRRLEQVGASGIIHETFEMSLQLGGAVLRGLGTPNRAIQEIILEMRRESYAPLSNVIFPIESAPAPPTIAIATQREPKTG
jgi:CPA2 family monovalent cation:H+ antiporter-2